MGTSAPVKKVYDIPIEDNPPVRFIPDKKPLLLPAPSLEPVTPFAIPVKVPQRVGVKRW